MSIRFALVLVALGGLLVVIGLAIPWPEVGADDLWSGPNPLAIGALLLGIVLGGVGFVLLMSELLGRWLRRHPTLRRLVAGEPS